MPKKWVLPEISEREARAMLVDELIWALRNRPQTFEVASPSAARIRDNLTGHLWWIANEYYGFDAAEDITTMQVLNFTWWQKKRIWRAVRQWMANPSGAPRTDRHTRVLTYFMALYDANHP